MSWPQRQLSVTSTQSITCNLLTSSPYLILSSRWTNWRAPSETDKLHLIAAVSLSPSSSGKWPPITCYLFPFQNTRRRDLSFFNTRITCARLQSAVQQHLLWWHGTIWRRRCKLKSVAVICTTTDSTVNGWRAITLLGLDGLAISTPAADLKCTYWQSLKRGMEFNL